MKTWSVASLVLAVSGLAGCNLQALSASPNAPAAGAAEERAAPGFEQTRADLDDAIHTATVGYTAGDQFSGRLDAFEPLEIPVTRGNCYVGAFVLDADAKFGPHARKGVGVESTLPGEVTLSHAGVIHGPGAVFRLGCPGENGKATADLIAYWGSALNKAHVHELGSGGFTLQLYVKSISESDLAAMKARQHDAEEREERDQREFARDQRRERDRRERDERDERDRRSAGAGADSRARGASADSGPQIVSVTLRNSCHKTVKVFFGQTPKFGSGTESSLSGNSVQSHSFRPGDMLWLLDDSGNGTSSVTAQPGMHEIEVQGSCSGFSTR